MGWRARRLRNFAEDAEDAEDAEGWATTDYCRRMAESYTALPVSLVDGHPYMDGYRMEDGAAEGQEQEQE